MSDPGERRTLLIVEDDPGLQKQLKWRFDEYQVVTAANRPDAIAAVRRHQPGVVLQDLGLPPDPAGITEGMTTLRETLAVAPSTKVIVVTGNSDRNSAMEAVANGAYDFCQKPLDVQMLGLIVSRAFHIHQLESEYDRLRDSQTDTVFQGIIGSDAAIVKLRRDLEKIAPSDASVLILGESGTGKELVARALHNVSRRRSKRFMAINCAAIPEALLESELFGHERGAFTGAVKTTIGKIEVANGGTLFLDEIGDMPVALQAKLLRFLQEKVIERIGGREEIPVDVRVVAATHRDPGAMMAAQRFREDLFYRIGEIILRVPPLRDRRGDAIVIAHSLLRKFAAAADKGRRGFTPDAIAAMAAHQWPGNIRELENKVRSAVIVADGGLISATDLGLELPSSESSPLNLREARANAERQATRQAIQSAGGNLSRAAELLGVSRPTLYDLVNKYGIAVPDREGQNPGPAEV